MTIGSGSEADELQLASSGPRRPLSTVVLIPPDSPRPSLSSYDCDGMTQEAPLLRAPAPLLASAAASVQAGSSSGGGCLQLPCTPAQLQEQYSPFSSTQSSLQPVCRICQCASSTDMLLDSLGRSASGAAATSHQTLISPCRCTGSLQYVHPKCLRKWIEVCQRRKCSDSSYGRGNQQKKQDSCELCGYVFRKYTTVKVKDWKFPNVSTHDKCLHSTFLVCVAAMLASVVAMVMFFAGNREHSASGVHYYLPLDGTGRLSQDEVASLISGVTFFASFFVAMVVEMKAKRTIYQILRRCVRHNTVWVIENYSQRHDP